MSLLINSGNPNSVDNESQFIHFKLKTKEKKEYSSSSHEIPSKLTSLEVLVQGDRRYNFNITANIQEWHHNSEQIRQSYSESSDRGDISEKTVTVKTPKEEQERNYPNSKQIVQSPSNRSRKSVEEYDTSEAKEVQENEDLHNRPFVQSSCNKQKAEREISNDLSSSLQVSENMKNIGLAGLAALGTGMIINRLFELLEIDLGSISSDSYSEGERFKERALIGLALAACSAITVGSGVYSIMKSRQNPNYQINQYVKDASK